MCISLRSADFHAPMAHMYMMVLRAHAPYADAICASRLECCQVVAVAFLVARNDLLGIVFFRGGMEIITGFGRIVEFLGEK